MRVSVELSVQIQRAADESVVLGVAAAAVSLDSKRWRRKMSRGRVRHDADAFRHLLHSHLAVAGKEVGAFGSPHLLAALKQRVEGRRPCGMNRGMMCDAPAAR